MTRRLLANRNVNPSEGIKPSESPNVGQYGWTNFEASKYNQLIEYVSAAEKALQTTIEAATYVAKTMKDEVEPALTSIRTTYNAINLIKEEIDEKYKVFEVNYKTFTNKYDNFSLNYDEFLLKYTDFTVKWKLVTDMYIDVNAKHQEVLENTKKVEDIYNEMKDGQVYRGTWNPSSGAYPAHEDTNSSWDVILDAGKDEESFDGKIWNNGNRLIWVKADNAYSQILSSAGVSSVNGKKGAVTLNAADVGALASSGGVVTGDLVVNTSLIAKNVGDPSESLLLVAKDENVLIGTNYVYHEGYKPTPNQIGAAAASTTINGHKLESNITLTASDVGALPSSGNAVMTGNIEISGNLTVRGNEIEFANLGVSGELSEKGHRVYSGGNKPTPADLGVLASTGGVVSGYIESNYLPANNSFVGQNATQAPFYQQLINKNGDSFWPITKQKWYKGGVEEISWSQGIVSTSAGISKYSITFSNANGASNGLIFDQTGKLEVPGQLVASNLTAASSDSEGGQIDLIHTPTGKTTALDIVQASNAFRIINSMAGPVHVWTFDGDGVFTLPGTIKSYYGGNAVEIKTAPHYTADVAQIFHNGTGTTGTSINLRSMRESQSATWTWEKYSHGAISYSTGINGGGVANIVLHTDSGVVSARQFTQLTSEGKEAKVYSEINPPSAEDIFVTNKTKEKESLLDLITEMREEIRELRTQLELLKEA